MKKILSTIRRSCCIVFMIISSLCIAQSRIIIGTVQQNDKPISNVNISLEGTEVSTITNSSGFFQIQIQGDNPILIFRHPNFIEQKIKVKGELKLNVLMAEKVGQIEEVVLNAGYYTVKDKEKTGSIAKITAKEIENQPVSNVLSAVQGRMAGVSITQNSGTPGGGFDIQIRGKNSLRRDGNNALYIVDGVVLNSDNPSMYSAGILPFASISSLNSINPNDIESIEVLKDADATAIYGSRGANGVVLITTKSGKKGAPQVIFNTSYGLSKVASTMKMMNTNEYLNMRNTAFSNDGISNFPANAYDINETWDKSRYTDWQKKLIGNTSEMSNNQFSISGGSNTTGFLISAAHSENTTVFPASYRYKTNTISSRFSYRPENKKWDFQISNLISFITNNTATQELTKKSLFLSPNAPSLYNAEGSLNWENNTFDNPVAQLLADYLNESKMLISNIGISYLFTDNLKFKLNTGYTSQLFEEYRLQPNTVYNPSFGLTSEYSSSSKNTRQSNSWMLEPQLNWFRNFNRHSFDVLLGATYQQDDTNQNLLTGYGFEKQCFSPKYQCSKNHSVIRIKKSI